MKTTQLSLERMQSSKSEFTPKWLVCILVMLLLATGQMTAQESLTSEKENKHTAVTVTDGIPDALATHMQDSISTWLEALNGGTVNRFDIVEDNDLRTLLSSGDVVSAYDSLHSVAVKNGFFYVVPHIYVAERTSDGFTPIELQFEFSSRGVMTRIWEVEKKYTLADYTKVDHKKASNMHILEAMNMVMDYKSTYEQKDGESFRNLFVDEARIKASYKSAAGSFFRHQNYKVDSYLSHLDRNVFSRADDISINFTLKHAFEADNEKEAPNEVALAMILRQRFESSNYQDEGNLLMVLNRTDNSSGFKVVQRLWYKDDVSKYLPGTDYLPAYQKPDRIPITSADLSPVVMRLNGKPTMSADELTARNPAMLAHTTKSGWREVYNDYEYWIIGGASALVGGVTYAVLSTGSSGPGNLPPAPGPPN